MTLGAVQFIYQNKGKDIRYAKNAKEADGIKSAKHSWTLFQQIITYSGSSIGQFEGILAQMIAADVADKRNALAHGGHIAQSIAQDLRSRS